jgi:hypothetical protein
MEEIISIEEVGYMDSIDIEVDGNHLFFANGILTHNSNSDIEMEHISESIGLPATCDLLIALVVNEELDEMNQVMFKQLKNRYGDINYHKRFCVGVDKPKMRLYDLENSTEDLIDDSPVMDRTEFGVRDFDLNKFKDFK